MIQFDRISLGRQAKELNFIWDTFEKVQRLAGILEVLEKDELFAGSLALKGGTAINLTIFDLPRLSVDIDIDFSEMASRESMAEKRNSITKLLWKYLERDGYERSSRSKHHYALDSFVLEYQNAGEMRDNLKIEINYMLRSHIFPPSRRTVKLPWLDKELTVLCVAPMEIFASKIVALISRTAPRDLYDVNNMLKHGLFDESEQDMLRKCVAFYLAIGSDLASADMSLKNLWGMPQRQIKTDLAPVLHNGDFFDLKSARGIVADYLNGLLRFTEQEKAFLENFKEKRYLPDLLFDDQKIQKRLFDHPMAVWKCRQSEEFTKDSR